MIGFWKDKYFLAKLLKIENKENSRHEIKFSNMHKFRENIHMFVE